MKTEKSLIFIIFCKIIKRRSNKYSIMKHPYPLAYDLSKREYLPNKRVSLLHQSEKPLDFLKGSVQVPIPQMRISYSE